MDKIIASKRLNRLTGGHPDEMLCHRIWVQQKLWGGFWLPLGCMIDICFYIIRRQRQHVRATYLLERRRRNAQAKQGTDGAPQEEAGTQ